jgi:hypothetical protein
MENDGPMTNAILLDETNPAGPRVLGSFGPRRFHSDTNATSPWKVKKSEESTNKE